MNRTLCIFIPILALGLAGCPKRDQPPESSYDPEIVDTAKRIVEESDRQADQADQKDAQDQVQAECSRETRGCPDDHLCWDSWYCKQGRDDQCSAIGDKRCHKRCADHSDCPKAMPRCEEKPIFKGSERGVLEKFCVAPD